MGNATGALAGRAAPKVVSPRNTERAAMVVAKPANRRDVWLATCPRRDADQNIDDWFGAQTRNGGASDVLDPKREVATSSSDTIGFGLVVARPDGVVRCNAEFARDTCHHDASWPWLRPNQAATLGPLKP